MILGKRTAHCPFCKHTIYLEDGESIPDICPACGKDDTGIEHYNKTYSGSYEKLGDDKNGL